MFCDLEIIEIFIKNIWKLDIFHIILSFLLLK